MGLKLKPCPCCGSNDIIYKDCGYSTFNPEWYVCSTCSFTVAISFTKKGDIIANSWNEGVEKVKTILELTKKQRDILGFAEIYNSIKVKKKLKH